MTFKNRKRALNLLFFIVTLLFTMLLILYRLFPLTHIVDINNAAQKNSISPALIAATILMESSFNETAVSSSGAFGLMQLMPDTAEWLYEKNIITGNWREPSENIQMGSYYLKSLINRFDNVETALNGYHKGPNKIHRLLQNGESFDKTYSERIFIYQIAYGILYHGYFTNLPKKM